jgi:hypothetical protein
MWIQSSRGARSARVMMIYCALFALHGCGGDGDGVPSSTDHTGAAGGGDGAGGDAVTTPQEPPECTAEETRCEGTTQVGCLDGQWAAGKACSHACLDGQCAGVCSPGEVRCSGVVPETCGLAGEWEEGPPCDFVCEDGQCAGDCAPGDAYCDGAAPWTCDGAGKWQPSPPCPHACSNGQCVGVCAPGEKSCVGLVPRTCDELGQWVAGDACPYECTSGLCTGECSPGASQCSGLVPQSCDGSAEWDDGAPCPFVCSAGQCTGVCVPGAKRCQDTKSQLCDAAGQWQDQAACPFLCSAGECAGVCAPGAHQCSAAGLVQTCKLRRSVGKHLRLQVQLQLYPLRVGHGLPPTDGHVRVSRRDGPERWRVLRRSHGHELLHPPCQQGLRVRGELHDLYRRVFVPLLRSAGVPECPPHSPGGNLAFTVTCCGS